MIDRPGTGERVYLAIKSHLLSESALRPGERIDVRELCRRYGASATPVRAALYRMVGERLLASHPGEGFSMPRVTEPALGELYQWNLALLVNAARSDSQDPTLDGPDGQMLVLAVEDLFSRLAARSGNIEVEWAIAGVNDRLHRARRVELDLIDDFESELDDLRQTAVAGGAPLRQALVAYHRRRLRLSPAIVRRLHGLDDREPRFSGE